jgi:hypothetical protein
MDLVTLVKSMEQNGHPSKIFRINEYASPDINHAMAVVTSTPLGKRNNLKDLYALYNRLILLGFEEEIKALRTTNTKFIFVMDISEFPFVICYIDPTDEKFVGDATQFGRDVQALWDDYDEKKVIMIVVNLYMPHTGLKDIKF